MPEMRYAADRKCTEEGGRQATSAIRKYVLQYDNVMNKQREIIYGERKKVLFGEDLTEDTGSYDP